MTDKKRPMPPIPNPLPPDFSFHRFWCEWHGIDHAKDRLRTEASLSGRKTLGTLLSVNDHDCRQAEKEPPPSKRQARRLKNQSLPIPCPFCASLSREQQIEALMELLFDAIVEVAQGVMEGNGK